MLRQTQAKTALASELSDRPEAPPKALSVGAVLLALLRRDALSELSLPVDANTTALLGTPLRLLLICLGSCTFHQARSGVERKPVLFFCLCDMPHSDCPASSWFSLPIGPFGAISVESVCTRCPRSRFVPRSAAAAGEGSPKQCSDAVTEREHRVADGSCHTRHVRQELEVMNARCALIMS